jgi:hypothetical protein
MILDPTNVTKSVTEIKIQILAWLAQFEYNFIYVSYNLHGKAMTLEGVRSCYESQSASILLYIG